MFGYEVDCRLMDMSFLWTTNPWHWLGWLLVIIASCWLASFAFELLMDLRWRLAERHREQKEPSTNWVEEEVEED